MKIVITGTATAFDRDTDEVITDPERLTNLDGLAYDEMECGEFLCESLYKIGVIGGKIELRCHSKDALLNVITTYHSPRKLDYAELKELVDQTTGQWSDGIGEGEFQHAQELGIDVSIGSLNSEPTVEQFDDGAVVKKPEENELVDLLQNLPVREDVAKEDEDAAIDLVKRGAAIDVKNRYGQSVLELACRAVLPSLVELLLERAPLKTADAGNCALSALAYSYGSTVRLENTVRIARQLLDAGATVDATDKNGHTPLMMAANRNNLPLVKFLLSAGADINRQQADELNKVSVLMFAQNLEMVENLLEQGADPNIRTADGLNAYEYTLKNSHIRGYKEIAKLIEGHLTQ